MSGDGAEHQPSRSLVGHGRPRAQRLHDRIREDIVEGRLGSGLRLKTAELARRYGTSVNPIREALHHLQGEGIVIIEPNRGASVRAIGEDYARNIYEIRALVEPYLTRWFADYASPQEIARLEELQAEIERVDDDFDEHRRLNDAFHSTIYDRHFNQEAVELEFRQREVLHTLNRKFSIAPVRRRQVAIEHHGIIQAIRRHDGDAAARITEQHVKGASQHLIDQMRAAAGAAGPAARRARSRDGRVLAPSNEAVE